jgi:uncharacterized protein YyaL (SSP411 family)
VLGSPQAFTMFLTGLEFANGSPSEVIITGPKAYKIKKEFDHQYLPNTVMHIWSKELANSIEYLSDIQASEDSMIYVCKDFVCNLPTSKINEALKKIL